MAEHPPESGYRSGFVALVGRPNAGKSTLLNQVLGQKIAIVSDKPQTTRHRILGIKTTPGAQLVLVDTPGIHEAKDLLNKRMVAVAQNALLDADVVLLLVDATRGAAGLDPQIVKLIVDSKRRCCVALNKIDAIAKPALLPLMARLTELLPGREVVPVSALTGENVDQLLTIVAALLPEGPRLYGEDEFTDQTQRTLAQEIVREKVFEETHHEVPYSTAVTIDAFEEKPERHLVVIKATIHVSRASQKSIVIGKGGSKLKSIGQKARREIENVVGGKVFLELFVRVQEDWVSDPRRLKEFGL
jgi:GTP-binding protein Era